MKCCIDGGSSFDVVQGEKPRAEEEEKLGG